MINYNLIQEFAEAITESFIAYKEYGARSNAKIKPLHDFVARTLEDNLDKSYTVISMRKE